MDNPQKHYVKLKKSDTKENLFYYYIYTKCLEKVNLRRESR